MKNLKFAIIPFLFLVLGANFIFAQGLEVSPVRFDFELEAGSNETQVLTVRNTTNNPAIYTLKASDWVMDKEGNLVRLDGKDKSTHSCANWVSFSPALVELDANESMDVNVTMDVPSSDRETKWSIVYVTLQKEQEAPQADKDLAMGIEVEQAIGVFITQSPRSNKNAAAKITGFNEIASPTGKLFQFEAQNKGQKILDCNMYLVVSNLQTAEEKKLDPVTFRILPEGARIGELALPADLPAGNYMVAAILDFGPEYALEGVQKQISIK